MTEARVESKRIPLGRLPGIPALARGLAEGEPGVSAFLPDAPRLEVLAARARQLGPTSVVLTGQQAGLFTGPLLTMVKAVAARQAARALTADGAPARAAFWCASEDHDLVEVSRLAVPDGDGVRDLGPSPETLAGNRRPVGNLRIDWDLEPYLEAMRAAAGTTADAALAEELLRRQGGRTYYEAFAETLRWLLLDPDLPVVDAADPATKPALVPLAARLVRERVEVRALLAARAAALEKAGHPLQVTTDPHALPLFARVGGERLLLREEEGRFSLKGDESGTTFTEEEILARFAEGAWLPSFSALTRPLAASILFPVAGTVLGPAEVAYWAQMHPLFAWAGIVPPVLLLRPMVALVDPATRRLLETTGLGVEDVLEGKDALLARKGRERAGAALAQVESVEREADARLAALEPGLLSLDANLKRPLDATRQNVRFALGKLSEKVTAAAGRSDEVLAKKAARLEGALLPGGSLAERVYTPVPALLRWGREGLLHALEAGIRWDAPGLAVIEP